MINIKYLTLNTEDGYQIKNFRNKTIFADWFINNFKTIKILEMTETKPMMDFYEVDTSKNDELLEGCKGNCTYLGRPTYKYPCCACVTANYKFYEAREKG